MRKTPSMADALSAAAEDPPAPKTPPSRRGKAAFPVYLDPELHRRFRIEAARRGVSMQAAALDALECWLGG